MKKPEIKEYLSSIYNMDVVSVKTMNVEGELIPPRLSAAMRLRVRFDSLPVLAETRQEEAEAAANRETIMAQRG